MSDIHPNPILQSYLFFEGRCEEAIGFYQVALSAKILRLMRFKDSPEPAQTGTHANGWENKVLHAHLQIGDTHIMASDGRGTGKQDFQGFALCLRVSTEQEANKLFNALAEGGQIHMPLTKTFYSPRFGMVADKFGVMWMVMVECE